MTVQDMPLDQPSRSAAPRLGGWLLLLAVSIVLELFGAGLHLVGAWTKLFTSGAYATLTDPAQPAYHPLWTVLLPVDFAYRLISVPLLAGLAWAYFARHRWVPLAFAAIHGGFALFVVLRIFGPMAITPGALVLDDASLRELLQLGVSLCIWTPYLFLSERAQDTFIR